MSEYSAIILGGESTSVQIGDDVYVGDTIYTSFSQAFSAALASTDKNLVINGTDFSGLATNALTANLNVIGKDAPKLSGNGSTTLFHVNNAALVLTVKSVVIHDGTAARGGAIYGQKGTLNLIGATLSGNSSTAAGSYDAGGAVYMTSGSIEKSLFSGNDTLGKGGGVGIGASATISGSTFIENTAQVYGGAVYTFKSAVLTVSDSVFLRNGAPSVSGGALALDRSTGTISTSFFADNIATNGGAIFLSGGAVEISGSTFYTETDRIYNSGGVVTFSGENHLNADLTLSGSASKAIALENASFVFGNTTGISLSGMTFSGNNTLSFKGSAAVTFAANQNVNGADIVLKYPAAAGTYTLASNINNIGNVYISQKAEANIVSPSTGYLNGDNSLLWQYTLTGSSLAMAASGTLTVNGTGGAYNTAATLQDWAYLDQFTGTISVDSAQEVSQTLTLAASLVNNASITVDAEAIWETHERSEKILVLNNYSGSGSIAVKQDGALSIEDGNVWLSDAINVDAALVNVPSGSIKIGGITYQGTNYATLSGALADSDATAVVNDGTYTETLNIKTNKTVIGVSDASIAGNTDCAITVSSTLVVDGLIFEENTASRGAAIYDNYGNVTVNNAVFRKNHVGTSGQYYGGAFCTDHNATASINNSLFDSNTCVNNSGAVYVNSGSVRISGSTFATETDRIRTWGSVTFAGTNYLNAGVATSGNAASITAEANAALIFGNTAAIGLAGLTFSGNNAVTFNGSATVTFASQNLSGVAITVGVDTLPEAGESFTIASGVTGMNNTITVKGVADPVALGSDVVIGGNTYTYALDGTNFKVSRAVEKFSFVSAAPEGKESIVIQGNTIALLNRYDTLEEAQANVMTGGTVAVAYLSFDEQASPCNFTGVNSIVYGSTFTDHAQNSGGAIYTTGDSIVYDSIFIGDHAQNHGGAIYTTGDSIVCGSTFTGNYTQNQLGGAISSAAGSIVIDGSVFVGNTAARRGGALSLQGQSSVISGSTFTGNTACGNSSEWDGVGGAIYLQKSGGTLTLDGTTRAVVFDGNVARDAAGALWVRQGAADLTGTVKFLTASDSVNVRSGGTILIHDADVTLNADLTSRNGGAEEEGVLITVNNSTITFGGETDVSALNIGANVDFVFSENARVNFTAQDLSAASIRLNNSGYTGGNFVAATGVSALGTVNFGENADRFSYTLSEGTLSYSAVADVKDGDNKESFTGGTYNLMTGGTIAGAYVGIRNPEANANVKNVISGGTVGEAFIGGALVSQGSKATLGTVTLHISGNADIIGGSPNGGMLYTAGYAYGTNPDVLDSTATLTVAKSVLDLTSGSIPAQNLYSGAHARKGAYTVVNQTEVNVSGGSFARVYGGGWAEKVGKSEVGSSTISITGGTVDIVYAGGGNAEGGTTVVTGAVDISVSGNAQVGIAFLAGKNMNCSTNGAVTMTVSGNAKTMTRISGWNANGKENTSLTTLDLRTSLDVEYLDHVDVVRIAEGKTLNVSAELWYESASALQIDFDLDGALDTDWTAMSGVGMDIYQAAQYTIDGGSTVYTYDSATGKLVNGTTESGYGLNFTNDNKVKFVTIA